MNSQNNQSNSHKIFFGVIMAITLAMIIAVVIFIVVSSGGDKTTPSPVTNAENILDDDDITLTVADDGTATVSFPDPKSSGGTITLSATLTRNDYVAPQCETDGLMDCTAKFTYDGHEYTHSERIVISPTGHTYGSEYTHTQSMHYRVCTVCHKAESEGTVHALTANNTSLLSTCDICSAKFSFVQYALNSDNRTYSVSLTEWAQGDVIIPAYYSSQLKYDYPKAEDEQSSVKAVKIMLTAEGDNLAQDLITRVQAYTIKDANGKDVFVGNDKVTQITIPAGVTQIDDNAFADFSVLTKVTINGEVTSIGNKAFYDCAKLKTINLPATLTNIGKSTFYGCQSLTSLTVNGDVALGEQAFVDSGIVSITFNGTADIGEGAFLRCEDLLYVTINNNASSANPEKSISSVIYSNAFDGCTKISQILVDSGYINIIQKDGIDSAAEQIDVTKLIKQKDESKTVYIVIGGEDQPLHTHKWDEDRWVKDDEDGVYHYRQCADDETLSTNTNYKEEHTFVYVSDQTEHWQKCSVCGYESQHTEHSQLVYDHGSSEHWQKCPVCNYKTQAEEHSSWAYKYDAEGHTSYCTVCLYEEDKQQHDTPLKYSANATEHWQYCDECGYKSEHESNDILVTSYDNTAHWSQCPNCGYTTLKQSHSASRYEADESQHWQKCTGCDYITQKTNHDEVSSYKIDGDEHVKYCATCQKELKRESNTLLTYTWNDSGEHWQVCQNDCGYTSAKQSHGTLTYDSDKDYHWQVCTVCGYATEKVSHGTLNYVVEDGQHWQLCPTCNYTTEREDNTSFETKYDESGHWLYCATCQYKGETEEHTLGQKTDGDYHWMECACGYITDKQEHSWSEWTQDEDNNLMYDRTCSGCSYMHTFDHSKGHFITEFTETAGSTHTGVCQICSESVTESHTYLYIEGADENGATQGIDETKGVWYVDEDNTTHYHECMVCKSRKDEGGHQSSFIESVASTCTTKGNIEYYMCITCKYNFADKDCIQLLEGDVELALDSNNHDIEHIDAAAKSCYDDGNIEYWKCRRCLKYFADEQCTDEITYDDTIIPASHEWGTDWVFNTQDTLKHYHQCSVCAEYDLETAQQHTNIIYVVVNEQLGSSVHQKKCTDCGYTIEEEHEIDDSKYDSDDQSHWQTCAKCEGKTSIVDHSYSAWITTTNPTCVTQEVQQRTCSICGHVQIQTLDIDKDAHVAYEIVDDNTSVYAVAVGLNEGCTHEQIVIVDTYSKDNYVDVKVTTIGQSAFANTSSKAAKVQSVAQNAFKTIIISANVETISDYAFSGQTQLTTIMFNESSLINKIGEGAFSGCSALSNIYYTNPKNSQIASIADGNNYFTNATAYYYSDSAMINGWHYDNLGAIAYWSDQEIVEAGTIFELNDDYLTITGFTKDAQSIMEDYTIPEFGSYTTGSGDSAYTTTYVISAIGEEAFKGCTNLKSLTLSGKLTTIGANAFVDCSLLTHITLGEKITTIGNNAFKGCTSLSSIEYDSLNCGGLTESSNVFAIDGKVDTLEVTIGSDVTSIPAYLFNNASITKVTFAEGSLCTSIGERAFAGCSNLTEINVPEKVYTIGAYAFADCVNVTRINYSARAAEDNTNDQTLKNLFDNTGTSGDGIKLFIAKNVEKISMNMFHSENISSPKIVSIQFEDGAVCNNLRSNAFYGCTYLSEIINIPQCLITMDDQVFNGCVNLTTITIPDCVESIGYDVFKGATNIYVTFGNVYGWYYEGDSSSGMVDVNNIKWADGTSILKNQSTKSLDFELSADQTYYSVSGIGNALDSQVIYVPASFGGLPVTEVNSGAFAVKDNTSSTVNITEVYLPETITQIGDSAFENSNITYISLPSTIKVIGNNAFKNCANLEDISIPQALTDLGASAFENTAIKTVVLPSGLITFGSGAFAGCTSLASVEIGEGIKAIPSNAFAGCTSLESVVMPQSLNTINVGAFDITWQGDITLTSITVNSDGYWYYIDSQNDNANICVNIQSAQKLTQVSSLSDIYYVSSPAKLTHNFDEWTIDTVQTCDNPGLEHHVCQECNWTVDHVLEATGLHFTYNQYTEDGATGEVEITGLVDNCSLIGASITTDTPSGGNDNTNTEEAEQAKVVLTIPQTITVDGDTLTVVKIGATAFLGRPIEVLVLPESVRIIGDSAFKNCQQLSQVIVQGDSKLTTIETAAFADSSLSDITIPHGVTTIGDRAFRDAYITNINIPDTVVSIGANVFVSSKISSNEESTPAANPESPKTEEEVVALNSGVTVTFENTNGWYAKDGSIMIDVTSSSWNWSTSTLAIENRSTSGLEYELSSSADYYIVKGFGSYTIEGAISLIIPSSVNGLPVREIADGAFARDAEVDNSTNRILSIVLPDSLTTIGEKAFANRNVLESMVIPASVSFVVANAFSGCTNLKDIDFERTTGWYYINDDDADEQGYCIDVTTSDIEEEIISASYNMYRTDDTEVIAHLTHNYGNWVDNENGKHTRTCSCGNSETSDHVYTNWQNEDAANHLGTCECGATSLAEHVYNTYAECEECGTMLFTYTLNSDNSSLTLAGFITGYVSQVTIPDSVNYTVDGQKVLLPVTAIKNSAFENHANLRSIVIGKNIRTIDNRAFYNCSNLESVTFADNSSLTQIGQYAFYHCTALTQIELPKGLTTIDYYAFSGDSNLTKVTLPITVKTINNDAFKDCYRLVEVYNLSYLKLTIGGGVVDNGGIAQYAIIIHTKASEASRVKFIDGYIFYEDIENDDVYLVGYTGSFAIGSSTSDSSADTTIEESQMVDLALPELPEEYVGKNFIINKYAFTKCITVKTVAIPNSVIEIGDNAFSQCTNLSEIKLESGSKLVVVGNGAFVDCNKLSVIPIPEKVEVIGELAFSQCSSLEMIEIPASVKQIGEGAFLSSNLKSIYFDETKVWYYVVENQQGGTCFDVTSEQLCSELINGGYSTYSIYRTEDKAVIATLIHSYSQWQTKDEATHSHTCTICDYVDEQPHTFANWKYVDEDTHSGVCTACAQVTSASHDYAEAVDSGDGATHVEKCNDCGNELTEQHNVTKWVDDEDVLNAHEGTCIVCNAHVNAVHLYDNDGNCTGCGISAFSVSVMESDSTMLIIGLTDAAKAADTITNLTIPEIIKCDNVDYNRFALSQTAFNGCANLEEVIICKSVKQISAGAFEGCTGLKTITFEGDGIWYYENMGGDVSGGNMPCVYVADADIAEKFVSQDGKYYSVTLIRTTDEETMAQVSHNYSLKYTVTDTEHIYTCNNCGYVNAQAHTYERIDNQTGLSYTWYELSDGRQHERMCTVCESAQRENHIYTSAEKINNQSHSETCSKCGRVITEDHAYDTSTGLCICGLNMYTVNSTGSGLILRINSNVKQYIDLRSISIPSSLEYNGTVMPVTQIASDSFNGLTTLDGVTIPSSITSIGSNAFAGCTNLKRVTFDGTPAIKSIDSYAFSGCSSLSNITLPSSLQSIGANAFEGCSSLSSVELSDGITSIGSNAFNGCSLVTQINVPASLTSITSGMFAGLTGLTSIEIPDNITAIGQEAFKGCSSLKTVKFGDACAVKTIGTSAFEGCSSLTSFTIPNKVGVIGNSAFASSGLRSISVPSGVYDMGTGVFKDCKNLTSATYADDITLSHLSAETFSGDVSLKTFTVPEKIIEIGQSAFKDCSALTSITLHSAVADIGSSAFENSGLTAIDIPDSLTNIQNRVFFGCTKLTQVTIPLGIEAINTSAFEGCTSLSQVTFANLTSSRPSGSEDSSTVDEIIEANNLSTIGARAFAECSLLESISMPAGLTSIGEYAFVNCTQLTTVELNGNLTYIGEGAFKGCTQLNSITIPNSVTTLGASAFEGCTALESVKIGNQVSAIEENTFAGCTALSSVAVGAYDEDDNVADTDIGAVKSGAFKDCTSLTTIFIPNSVTAIGAGAFEGCTNLTSLTLQEMAEGALGVWCYKVDGVDTCINSSAEDIANSMVSGYLSQQDVYRRNSKEVVSTLSHDFNVTSNDDTTHTAKCERCGFEVVDEEHTYSDGVCTVCAKAQ